MTAPTPAPLAPIPEGHQDTEAHLRRAQEHAEHDEEDDQGGGIERQAAFEWPRAPLPDGVAGHR